MGRNHDVETGMELGKADADLCFHRHRKDAASGCGNARCTCSCVVAQMAKLAVQLLHRIWPLLHDIRCELFIDSDHSLTRPWP